MHKRMSIGFLSASLLVQPIAYAHEVVGSSVWDGFSGFLSPDWSKDFSVTLGTKVWLNDWSLDRFINSGFTVQSSAINPDTDTILAASASDTAPDGLESDQEAVPIPQLSVRYKWLFATASYYSKTTFEFDDLRAPISATTVARISTPGTVTDLFTNITGETLFQLTAERYEWDAAGGIYVHPYVTILGGYKKIRQEANTLATATVTATATTTITDTNGRTRSTVITPATQRANLFSDVDIEGPTIGIAASVPIQSGFGIYASYGHGFMDAELRNVNDFFRAGDPNRDSRDRDTDATYDVAEGGVSYTYGTKTLLPHMPLSAATAYAGYRYQAISTEFDEPVQDRSDITRGFAVGVNLSF